jgi:hypothetical protein
MAPESVREYLKTLGRLQSEILAKLPAPHKPPTRFSTAKASKAPNVKRVSARVQQKAVRELLALVKEICAMEVFVLPEN